MKNPLAFRAGEKPSRAIWRATKRWAKRWERLSLLLAEIPGRGQRAVPVRACRGRVPRAASRPFLTGFGNRKVGPQAGFPFARFLFFEKNLFRNGSPEDCFLLEKAPDALRSLPPIADPAKPKTSLPIGRR